VTTGGPNDSLEIAKSYLRSVSWMLQLVFCDCPDWLWNYPAVDAPSVQSLIACTEKFSGNFEFRPPMPRLAFLLIHNTSRVRPDLPQVCSFIKSHPQLGKYFDLTLPLEPFPVELFLEIYEKRYYQQLNLNIWL